MTAEPLYWWSARDLAAAIRRRELSAREVMRAHLDRIEEVNDRIRAVVSPLPASAALRLADEADRAAARGDALGPLHGLPTAVKDLMDVRGFPTTHGSAAHAGAPPATVDSVLAARLRAAGALIIGKTNTPEHGLGTLTFNPLFGTTVTPWDLTRHAGGSSGGAAAALAAGMLPIADGSDSGGSLRYPAAFCNVAGLRPTPGTVPSGRRGDGWSPHAVLGPMGRDCADAALLLSAISGLDPGWPLSWVEDPGALADLEPVDLSRVRLAWSADAGGLEVSAEVRQVHAAARAALVRAGATVVDAEPDFTHADRLWETVETFEFFAGGRSDVDADPGGYRPDYLRNVEQGRRTTAADLAEALARRTDLFRDTARLLADHDALVLPAAPVVPPPVEVEWVEAVGGVAYDRYFRWQRMANRITATGHPALVTPGGWTPAGLPVGLQVVGRYRGDRRLLSLGAAIERALGHAGRRPPL
ncbi:amidase family protein [Phytohabitans sp. ZYX-F-186]|uniref:Amidase family protein n=1 Tax=Phytohabitans maris TaxID=3071409 RepID=A0ABU0ZBD7_9ACTN|nr:amidase family protein [Phytohabitans sp. ZYX-F-186]MDQ7903666.1 amidase family protein [Phytohabitans sp. ZYX-F-186]